MWIQWQLTVFVSDDNRSASSSANYQAKSDLGCRLFIEYNDGSLPMAVDLMAPQDLQQHHDWLRVAMAPSRDKHSSFSELSSLGHRHSKSKQMLSMMSCFIDLSAHALFTTNRLTSTKPTSTKPTSKKVDGINRTFLLDNIASIYLWILAPDTALQLSKAYCFNHPSYNTNKENLNSIFERIYPLDSQDTEDNLLKLSQQTHEWDVLWDALSAKYTANAALLKGMNLDALLKAMAPLVLTEVADGQPQSEPKPKPKPTTALTPKKVWQDFSKDDLDNLVVAFNDWQQARGQHTLSYYLKAELQQKIDAGYELAFWSNGTGVSEVVKESKPPRHTSVFSLRVATHPNDMNTDKNKNKNHHNNHNISSDLINTAAAFCVQKEVEGIAYCIKKPTSLDRSWTPNQWHNIVYSNKKQAIAVIDRLKV